MKLVNQFNYEKEKNPQVINGYLNLCSKQMVVQTSIKLVWWAKGYSQREGIDYEDTFAPVAKLNTIRMLISLDTKYHWSLHQQDVKYSFLNGDLK